VLECVINVSEGRSRHVLDALARACGPALLDLHTDADHHRSVFTLATVEPGGTELAARALAVAAAEVLDLTEHEGVHPRLGVIDVVPFVALPPTPRVVAVDAARAFAEWVSTELAIPAFLYDFADSEARTLPSVRRDAFSVRAPDAGPPTPDPRLGATAVGARDALIAVNLELADNDVHLVRRVARAVRERDGGLVGVRALGLELPSVQRAQVSMNLVDLETTGLERACVAARALIESEGGRVSRLELVGLAPLAAIGACSSEFLAWSGLGADDAIETRAHRATSAPAGSAAAAAAATRGADRANPA
jgi:glutamate formiminotransferase